MQANEENLEKCIKLLVNGDALARFICPDCHKIIKKKISEYMTLNQVIKIKCRCSCGCRYTAFIERRNNFRKPVNIPGTFMREGNSAPGMLLIKDVSLFGLGLKISASYNLEEQEIINVEFNLNDRLRSFIRRSVIIRNINKFNVNTEFYGTNNPDNYETFLLYK